MARLRLQGIEKSYGSVQAVRGIDLDVAEGEFAVLVGPSGCGKSTLLRCIAGLEEVDAGTVVIGDDVVNDVRPRDRNLAMVFQNYALYPYMNVRENIAFGLKARRTPAAEIETRVRRAADMLGIGALLDRLPRQLSGGQRQRVAIGRAIVRDARLFLFDEPLSNLDAQLRDEMRTEIKRLHQELGKTMIYVTHDQIEAMTLADRIVLLREGAIEQEGAPLDLFERPVSRFVARFLGSPPINFIPGRFERDGTGLAVRCGDGRDVSPARGRAAALESRAGSEVDSRRASGTHHRQPPRRRSPRQPRAPQRHHRPRPADRHPSLRRVRPGRHGGPGRAAGPRRRTPGRDHRGAVRHAAGHPHRPAFSASDRVISHRTAQGDDPCPKHHHAQSCCSAPTSRRRRPGR